MAEEQAPGSSGDGPWLTVTAAARQMGISPRAVRGRIRRGTIEWKPQGNAGRLVRVPSGGPSGDVSRDDPGDGPGDELAELVAEIGDLREALARSEAERDAAGDIAKARVDAAEARAAAVRELANRLTSELVAARAELAEARRPWLARMLAALRAR